MRIVVFEIHDRDSDIFDKIMEIVESHPDIECLRVKDEPMLSLPGLEIYPGWRKIYRDRREINLTTKEYDLLCLFAGRSGERMPMGMRAMPSDAISAICGKSCTRRSRMRLLPFGA